MKKAILLASIFFLTSCNNLLPLMGEGPPSGYIGGDIPDKYKGVRNPFSLEDQLRLDAGRKTYEVRCAVCHGSRGRGDGPRWPYLEPKPADFAAPPMVEAFRKHQDYVFWWVKDGVEQTAMPAWGDELTEAELWQVITYSWYLAEQAAPVQSPARRRYYGR